MKSKRLLRFYFAADSLDRALDNLILLKACLSGGRPAKGECIAEEICSLVGAKSALSDLWNYLDGVISGMSPRERVVLERFALSRGGAVLGADDRREIKRAVVKFTRHARALHVYAEGAMLVREYYALCFND